MCVCMSIFVLRFQEIAGALENKLCLPLAEGVFTQKRKHSTIFIVSKSDICNGVLLCLLTVLYTQLIKHYIIIIVTISIHRLSVYITV